jgi:broad specificity phosphatase PhoE
MPRTHEQRETFFKEGGKMTKELMREFNETYEKKRNNDIKEWPSAHYDPILPDVKTAAEANEVQGLNKRKPEEGESFEEIIKRAKVAVSERDMDPYSARLVSLLYCTDTFGYDWRNLDILRRRFVDDHDLIVDLLKVVDGLTNRTL